MWLFNGKLQNFLLAGDSVKSLPVLFPVVLTTKRQNGCGITVNLTQSPKSLEFDIWRSERKQ